MNALFYLLNSVAVIMILFAWYKINALRRRIPGGLVKAVCNVLSEFIGLFALGFLAFSLFPLLPEVSREIMLSLVFISAAGFSIIIINFFSTIAVESGF
jgi:hypothetical protein